MKTSQSKKVQRALQSPHKKRLLLKRFILRKFKKLVTKESKELLNSPHVKKNKKNSI